MGLVQLADLGQHVGRRRAGGVGAVRVEDCPHDAVAVVDGLDPLGDGFGAGVSTSTMSAVPSGRSARRRSAISLAQNEHQEVAKTVTGEVVSWVVANFQAFRSKRWKR